MITEDEIRNLFADDELPAPLAPAAIRRRAHALRRVRQGGVVAAVAIVVPAVVFGVSALPSSRGTTVTGSGGSSGTDAALNLPDGSMALRAPHMYAWTTADGVCYGEGPLTTQFRSCVTADDVNHAQGWTLNNGVGGAIVRAPVIRAEFIIGGTRVVPAQVVGFAHNPQWRILTADLKVPDSQASNVEVLGWDAAGSRVLVLGDCSADCAPGVVAPSRGSTTTTTSLAPSATAQP